MIQRFAAQLLPEWRQQDSLMANATAGCGKAHLGNVSQQTEPALPLSASLKILQAPAAYNRPIVQKKLFRPPFIVRTPCTSTLLHFFQVLLSCLLAFLTLPCQPHAAVKQNSTSNLQPLLMGTNTIASPWHSLYDATVHLWLYNQTNPSAIS